MRQFSNNLRVKYTCICWIGVGSKNISAFEIVCSRLHPPILQNNVDNHSRIFVCLYFFQCQSIHNIYIYVIFGGIDLYMQNRNFLMFCQGQVLFSTQKHTVHKTWEVGMLQDLPVGLFTITTFCRKFRLGFRCRKLLWLRKIYVYETDFANKPVICSQGMFASEATWL